MRFSLTAVLVISIIALLLVSGCVNILPEKTGAFGPMADSGRGRSPALGIKNTVPTTGEQGDHDEKITVYFTVDCNYRYRKTDDQGTETAMIRIQGDGHPLELSRYSIDHDLPFNVYNTSELHMAGEHELACMSPCVSYGSTYDGPVLIGTAASRYDDTPQKQLDPFFDVEGYEKHYTMMGMVEYNLFEKYVELKDWSSGNPGRITKNSESYNYYLYAHECFSDRSASVPGLKNFTFQDGEVITYSYEDQYSTAVSTAVFHISPGSSPFSVNFPDSSAPLTTTPDTLVPLVPLKGD